MRLGPVSDAICNAIRVLVVVSVPGMAEKRRRECGGVVLVHLVRWSPHPERIVLVAVDILLINPRSELMDRLGNEFDEPRVNFWGARTVGLLVENRLCRY